MRMLWSGWRGTDLVTEWGCRRCSREWEEVAPKGQIEPEMRERNRASYRETVRRAGGELDPAPRYVVQRHGGSPSEVPFANLFDANAVALALAFEQPGQRVVVHRDGVETRSWRMTSAGSER